MEKVNSIKKIKSKTKCNMVVDEVVSMIVREIYKKCDKLPSENILCSKFGVSRVTIRESFKKLSMMGVVTIKQGEGTYVSQIDMKLFMKPILSSLIFNDIPIYELNEARLIVESGTVALAARYSSRDDIVQLRMLLFQMRQAIQHHDLNGYAQLDVNFHSYIGKMSNNSILHATYLTIKDILDGYILKTNRDINMIEASCKGHEQFIDAIDEGNESLAAEIMRGHVRHARMNLTASMIQSEESKKR